MFKNYFKVAVRNLYRHKLFSLVNVFCLSIGITFSMIIGVYVLQQKKVNGDLKNVDRQYFVKSIWKDPNMGLDITALGPLVKTMRQEYPGLVANYYRFNPFTNVVSAGDMHFREDVAICDTTLVSMYGLPLVYGDPKNAFPNSSSALVTETTAMKLFGRTDVLGKTVTIQTLTQHPQEFSISGVLKDRPYNTVTGSFTEVRNSFAVYVPIEHNHYYPNGDGSDDWTSNSEVSLLELNKGVKPVQLERAFREILQKYTTKEVQNSLRFELAPLKTYYLDENGGAMDRMTKTLSLVALLILLLAIINFININIGTSAYRLKEIGLRKVFGGERVQLIGQFMMESLTLTLLAAILSLGFYEILRPAFAHLLQWQLDPLWHFGGEQFLLLGLLVLGIGLVAGFYPAFVLSASNIILAVKGKLNTAKGGLILRKSLLVIQFTLAIVVFICALTVSKQLSYAFSKDLGYDKDRLLMIAPFPKQWDSAGVARIERIKQGLLQLPAVKDGTLCFDLTDAAPSPASLVPDGAKDNKPMLIANLITDEKFASTFGLHIAEGNFFAASPGASRDEIVLNESAVRAFGWTGKSVVGKKIRETTSGRNYTVAGVVHDFNYADLAQAIGPLVFTNVRENTMYRFLTVKLNTPDIAAAIAAIRSAWKELSPNTPFEYSFLDDRFKAIYKMELQLRDAAGIATVLNLVIVFLGIFGVVAFTLAKRSKEMAVRKVLGAEVRHIIGLFIRDYAGLLLLANLIGWPLAWMLTGKWLENFVYRAPQDLGPYLFVLLFILVTVSGLVALQCLRTALDNPVNRLRAE